MTETNIDRDVRFYPYGGKNKVKLSTVTEQDRDCTRIYQYSENDAKGNCLDCGRSLGETKGEILNNFEERGNYCQPCNARYT